MRRSLGIVEPEPGELEITRMRRRHLKGVMAIERRVYPRPWSPNLFLAEMNIVLFQPLSVESCV